MYDTKSIHSYKLEEPNVAMKGSEIDILLYDTGERRGS